MLSRAFGVHRIDLIEDMVQSAMLEAMRSWQQKGVPDNPAGWIHRVARNRIVDALRREATHQRAMAFAGQTPAMRDALLDQWLQDDEVPDSLMRMMFVCCHDKLDRQSQVALTLKILCGFSNHEIARGLLLKTEAVKKRIQRAKGQLAKAGLRAELPAASQLQQRLHAIHEVLYLLFNEGYSTSSGINPIRDDLCEEAARLCHILCGHELGTTETYALLALMLFHAARLDSRVDGQGAVILLEDQDRSTWNHDLIGIGCAWLRRAGIPTSHYHLEAAIAMLHCKAPSVSETDWTSIVGLYDRLIEQRPSVIYEFNRSIAIAQAGEVDRALDQLQELRTRNEMNNQRLLLECAIAHLFASKGQVDEATNCYRGALTFVVADHERKLIERKLMALTG